MNSSLNNKLSYILAIALLISITVGAHYRHSLISLEEKIKKESEIQEVKVQYITEYIDREKIIYKDKIKYIKEYVYDNNKTECENALNVIRSTNL